MRQKYFVRYFFSFSVSKCSAQKDTTVLLHSKHDHFLFSLSFGIAAPFADLAEYQNHDPSTGGDYTGNIAGFAGTGFAGKAQAMYFFSENFGMAATFYASSNKAHQPDSADLLYEPCNCYGNHGLPAPVIHSYSYDTKSWQTGGLLLGLVAVASKGNPELLFRLSGGVQQVRTPESTLSTTGTYYSYSSFPPYVSKDISYTKTQPVFKSTNFVFDGGFELNIHLKNRFGILTSMEFLMSHASFDGDVVFEKDVYLFSLTAGISYAIK